MTRNARPGAEEPELLTGQGAAIDTITASGKLVFGIFAAQPLSSELANRQTELLKTAIAAVARKLGDRSVS